jgi:hypothetical protein
VDTACSKCAAACAFVGTSGEPALSAMYVVRDRARLEENQVVVDPIA